MRELSVEEISKLEEAYQACALGTGSPSIVLLGEEATLEVDGETVTLKPGIYTKEGDYSPFPEEEL